MSCLKAIFLFLLLAAVSPARSQTFLIDFGAAGTPTSRGDDPNDPIFYWNNVSAELASSTNGLLTNLVTTANLPTPAGLRILSRFNGANENGTTASPLFPLNATRDSLFGNTEVFNGISDIFPSFKLTGLDPTADYTFTFYASRLGVGDVRETLYTLVGATTATAALDVANNEENTAQVTGIKPTSGGEITISLAPTENNNNGNHFTYLGVLEIEAVPPQSPLAFTKQPSSTTAEELQSVSFSAAVSGPAPYFIQWFANGAPIQDANQFIFTIPSIDKTMDGTRYSVTVSNLAFGVTSSNATLRVVSDARPPVIVSATAGGSVIEILFNEPIDANSVTEPSNYTVNNGALAVQFAELRPDGKTVAITTDEKLSGTVTVKVSGVADVLGNIIVAGSPASATIPVPLADLILIDFGGGGTMTENAPAPDDAANVWNNVAESVGTVENGELLGLVKTDGTVTTFGYVTILPFNGANQNGTLESGIYATDATRDSLFGNTELFNNKSDIFPKFKLTGLDPSTGYSLTFYASRLGVGDNRETGYTITGAGTAFATLNVANNISNQVTVAGVKPDAAGEITIDLAPTSNNNNANHFTYLGVLKLQATPTDTNAPTIVSASSTDGLTVMVNFSEALKASSITNLANYIVNNGAVTVTALAAGADGKSLVLTLSSKVSGSFTVKVSGVQDLAGNTISASAQISGQAPSSGPVSMLFDFGGANTTEHATAPDDPVSFWNNITATTGGSSTGRVSNLVGVDGSTTAASLAIVSRFNGANENGTTTSPLFASDATRDSLFGNTEVFSGLSNIFPSFKLTGLDPAQAYSFTFFGSRTGVTDVRETVYSVTGANLGTASLNAANNVTNTAVVQSISPTSSGEITISLAPSIANNNGNHFTYLGVMRVDPVAAPAAFLFDLGGANTTEHAGAPDDPVNYWNNITATVGGSPTGVVANLISADGRTTSGSFVIVSRFNGANENGTTGSTLYPSDATRDSLFGNTEVFSGVSNIFPSFKLTGLSPAQPYTLTFFASRTGVTDVRETAYTVTGANNGLATLNAANNVTNVAVVQNLMPTAVGEITVSLAPTTANNNANHFTYLGVLRVEPSTSAPKFTTITTANGQVTLTWTGSGKLESAPTVTGPWTQLPTASSPFSEPASGFAKFYRLR